MSLKNVTRPVACIAAALALVGLSLGMSGRAVEARSGVVPIEIEPDSALTAGKSSSFLIKVSSAPANIRVFSQPTGIVAYQGTVTSTTTTLVLPVSASAPAGPATVTVSADGSTVSTYSTVVRLAPPTE